MSPLGDIIKSIYTARMKNETLQDATQKEQKALYQNRVEDAPQEQFTSANARRHPLIAPMPARVDWSYLVDPSCNPDL